MSDSENAGTSTSDSGSMLVGAHSEDSFNFAEWITASKLTEPGRKKLVSNALVDFESLVYLTDEDVLDIRLALGDRIKFMRHLNVLKGKPAAPTNTSTGVTSQLVVTGGNLAGEVTQPPRVGEQLSGASGVVSQVAGQQSFSFSEVAAFMAGGIVPQNLQVEANKIHSSVLTGQQPLSGTPLSGTPLPEPPSCFQQGISVGQQAIASPLQSALQGLQVSDSSRALGQVNQGIYSRQESSLPRHQPPSYGASRDSYLQTVPLYSPQNNSLPSRQSSVQCDVYGRTVLRDLLGINECQQSKQGEGLFLPVNFVSHVRGARGEEEEILQTPTGSRLYLSPSGKKITPEKLNQGLFFGANARILARLVPNLTPELALYLDYLRQLGDLLLNYTSTSVYCLDHEHRHEVLESGRPWNEINSSLQLNWLKRKDAVSPNPTLPPRVQGRPNSLFARNALASKSQIICYLFNSPEGCPFGSSCKFLHKCSVEGCTESHSALKHGFRGANSTHQPKPATGQLAIGPPKS